VHAAGVFDSLREILVDAMEEKEKADTRKNVE